MKKFPIVLFVITFLLFVSFTWYPPIQKISVSMVAKSLHNGKSVTANGEVFFQTNGGLMVTHFTSPFDQVVITNSKGEYKNYDIKNNTLAQSQGLDYSSKNSFFYCFLSGKIQDMGLLSFGYTLKNTRMEDKMVITTWLPPVNTDIPLSKVEIVHENFLPVFMGFFDKTGKPVNKVYYSNYQNTQNIQLPMNITEFQYLSDGDSVISKRIYSNIKINEQVDNTYLHYKIPSNARLVKPGEIK